ncbi:MAG: inositol monophosphatase family protein [Euzebya sp.]
MTRPDTQALLELATSAARRAGASLLSNRDRLRQGHSLRVDTKSSATDPVSVADADSERALVADITAARPDDSIMGEEGADRRGTSGLRWVIDPLDGTVNFLYGHHGWSVSVGVEQRAPDGTWRGLVGVVLDPLAGELFAARIDQPATCNGQEIRVNDPVRLPLALVATGFSYDPAHREEQAGTVGRVLSAARDIRRVGSAALDLCAVAAGRVDAYYEDDTQRWDVMAGTVIVTSAGGVVRELQAPGRTGGVVAAGPALLPHLAAVVGG